MGGFLLGGFEGEGVGFGFGFSLGVGVGFGFGTDGVGVGVGVDFSLGGEGLPHRALLQSTGLLMTTLHSPAAFCFGLSGIQLFVSSNTMSFLGGTHPSSSPLK